MKTFLRDIAHIANHLTRPQRPLCIAVIAIGLVLGARP